jgi:phosphatidylserine/phosphatidylglycerophosphate/cardiolipin synthase-like enzyme
VGGGLGRSGNAGSFNYTAPANTLNDENIVVIGDLEETDPTAKAANANSQASRAEIDRIITQLARPV